VNGGVDHGLVVPGGGLLVVSEGHWVPFSKGLMAQSLTATGLPPDRAYRVAREVERELADSGYVRVQVEALHDRVSRVLARMEGSPYGERFEKWRRLARQDQPVIILLGGATGVGKSTIASQLAHRLGIVRIISTDAVRQVMRAFFSSTLMPAIHFSSFDAGGAVRIPVGKNLNPHVVGFVEQVEMVNAGVAAIVDRAVSEGSSTVLEGVHIVPGFTHIEVDRGVVLPMVVVVREEELHRSHFLVRDRETNGNRPVQRYLQNFEEIRRIQDFILSRAEAEGTLVIDNLNIDDTVGVVLDALYAAIESAEGVTA
jgi:2-phosphoglycerate kinase